MVVIAQKFYFATNNVFKFKNKRKGRAKKIVWEFFRLGLDKNINLIQTESESGFARI